MEKSKVFFITPEKAWQRLDRIFSRAKLNIEKEEIVAIKLHFGELGNIRYIRPAIVRKVVDMVKKRGGKPFLTDTTTLYRHARQTMFDYLETARKNGFTPETMGCPIIIADGLKGNSGEWVELSSWRKLKRVKVAQAIFESDFLICLSHVTFHIQTGLGASIKNIAMGCTTKETKLAMHASAAKPTYNRSKCILCMTCVRVCPGNAFRKSKDRIIYEPEKCIGCGECIAYCPSGAIKVPWSSVLNYDLQKSMLDAVSGVISGFPPQKRFFINVALDVTPHCDCPPESLLPAVPDIGIFASYDAVACDKASFDFIKEAAAYPGSEIDRKRKGRGDEKINVIYPDIDMERYWEVCEQAQVGSVEYEIEKLS